MRRLGLVTLLSVLATAGCTSPTDPSAGLTLEASTTPTLVVAGDSLVATLRIRNRRASTAELNGHGCLALPTVLRDGAEVPWRGTSGFTCLAGNWDLTIPAGDEIVVDFPLAACRGSRHGGCARPAEPGVYALRFETSLSWPSSGEHLPVVETPFEVRE